jgi:hypothetical protein
MHDGNNGIRRKARQAATVGENIFVINNEYTPDVAIQPTRPLLICNNVYISDKRCVPFDASQAVFELIMIPESRSERDRGMPTDCFKRFNFFCLP